MIGQINSASHSTYDFSSSRKREDKHAAHTNEKKAEESKKPKQGELTSDEKVQVKELQKRDAHVRTHEMAHMAAAGSLAQGGPNYVFQTGPDGKNYAIGGNVKIDTSPGRTPEESIRKAQQIRAAATAPSDPSAQDMKVAAAASTMATKAQAKVGKEDGEAKANEIGNAKTEATGEITTSHRLFPTSETDSESEDTDSNQKEGRNTFAQQVAELYRASGESTEEPANQFVA